MTTGGTTQAGRGVQELAFKPDFADAAKRWEAYWQGEIIDRPVVCVSAPREGYERAPTVTYRDRVFGDVDEVIDRILYGAEATYHGGESIPTAWLSFGPDEIACFCGGELEWLGESGDTNWSQPFVDDWVEALPLQVQEGHPLWQRMLTLFRKVAERVAGKMLMGSLDLHTNMDLLSGVRGPEQLCLDLMDRPEDIDWAMESARAVFPAVWEAIAAAGRMREWGFCHGAYSPEGVAILQCDFSYMISPEMFRRWVLPALEEEAEIVRHAVYHWDGPGALVHTEDLIHSKGLHTLSYVPGDGRGTHLDYVGLLQRVQEAGKAVQVWGTPEEMKQLHRLLRPEKVMYSTSAQSVGEAEALLDWFVQHT